MSENSSKLNDFDIKDCGALFKRADLHIHSYGPETGSYDVKDTSMTPEAIVDFAIDQGIDVISITDHNEIENSITAYRYSQKKDILVILGIETSTVNGHLLSYFDKVEDLKKYHSALNIDESKVQCEESMSTCLKLTLENNGFCIGAHVDTAKGFIHEIGTYNNVLKNIVTHPALLALEISNQSSSDIFSINDENGEAKTFLKERNQILKLERYHPIAKVMNSDAHKMSSLGCNISGNKKITRLKMDVLCFNSFRIALKDPDSRVRIEELIPVSFPFFYGIATEGGFLGSQKIRFNKNLNSIIGGRGAGKSTLLQSIQSCAGNKIESDIFDSDAWPDRIKLYVKNDTGKIHEFIKDKYQDDIIYTGEESDRPSDFKIETYNQGKTQKIIRDAKDNPQALLDYFDEFISFSDLKHTEEKLRLDIAAKQTLVNTLRKQANRIPDAKSELQEVEKKLEYQKRQKLGELIELESNLQEGRKFREDIESDLKLAFRSITSGLADKTFFEQIILQEVGELKVGKEEYEQIVDSINKLSEMLDSKSRDIETQWKIYSSAINKKIAEWKGKESEILVKIDAKKEDLKSKGIVFNQAYIKQLTQEKAQLNKDLTILETQKKQYIKELKELKKLYSDRLDAKTQIYNERYKWVTKVNTYLTSTIQDFSIKIQLTKSGRSNDIVDYLTSLLSFHNPKKAKLKYLIQELGVEKLKECIERKKISTIKSVQKDGTQLFNQGDLDKFEEFVFTVEVSNRIMIAEYDDLPRITVSKQEKDEFGKLVNRSKDFNDLSLGQQHSIMLSILLYSESKYPLLIDQPEDNLDSEFIYKTIVANLKRIKERRQVIIVTHNANVAVLGDSELILPLKSTSQKAFVSDRGSIDNKETIKITCDILEGSKKAFKKRQEIYNIN